MNKDTKQHWEELLAYHSSPLLLTDPVEASDIVVASPHHAPRGFARMFCERNADENAGYLSRYLADLLNCSCLIACRYFFDPNKITTSDYFKFMEAMQPRLVIEIHGHGGKRAAYDIEISSGPNDPEFARDFAERLSNITAKHDLLCEYTISGDYSRIYYTAQFSVSVTDKRWHTLHIELPPALRKQQNGDLPSAAGYQLMEKIAEIIPQLDL